MTEHKIRLERLIGELNLDLEVLGRLTETNRRAAKRAATAGGKADDLDLAALGYTIHNIYCALESYFVRVAKFFENDLDPRNWHADLVGRMAVQIRGLRPRLLDSGLMADIDDLRRFRHAFRNVYGSGLDAARLTGIQAKLPGVLAAFGAAHAGFVESLRAIGREADGVGDGPRKGGE